MGVNSLPKTVTRQHLGCDLNPCPSAPESSTLTTRLPSHLLGDRKTKLCLIIHSRSSRNPEYPAKVSLEDFAVVGLTGIVENK